MNIQQLFEAEELAKDQPPRQLGGFSNEAYQRLCQEHLDEEAQQIAKRYQDSAS